jgi:histidinol-phosphate aminotransferase
VADALAAVPLDRYPDREALALRRALAERLDVAPGQIVVGNGTAELLWLTAFAYLRPGEQVLIVAPAFGEYARSAALMGATVRYWTARAEEGFAVSPEGVARALARHAPRMVFLCNPNNPTGVVTPLAVLDGWARAHPETLFVVDEAYLAFVAAGDKAGEGASALALDLGADNVLVMRSMTKDYALAGLRLGYAVGAPAVVAALARVRSPWNVNALAQAAGLAALADEAHLQASLIRLRASKRALVTGLQGLGWQPLPSAVHFFLVPVGDGAALRRRLMRRGVLVRDCASFGLPAYVRIAPRRPEENARLLAAIRETAP